MSEENINKKIPSSHKSNTPEDKSTPQKKKPLTFDEKFNVFSKKELKPYLDGLESSRKKYILILAGCIILTIIVCALYAIVFGSRIEMSGTNISFSTEDPLFQAIVAAVLFPVAEILTIKNLYCANVKKSLFPKLMKFTGDFEPDEIGTTDAELNGLTILPVCNVFAQEDKIKGKYKDLDINIVNLTLLKANQRDIRESLFELPAIAIPFIPLILTLVKFDKKNSVKKVFSGLYIKSPCKKKFTGKVIILQDKAKNPDKSLQKVNLEDPEFEKYFDVYGTDQVESRYMLTTGFMDRTVKLASSFKGDKKIVLSFENGNVNIFLESSKQMFDVALFKPAQNTESYKQIIKDLNVILKIIYELKLEQNIGL